MTRPMPDTALTSAELDELERLAKAATPGPWYQPDDINPELIFSGAPDEPAFLLAEAFREDSDADATYIASANPATILRLLSLARAGLEAGKAEAQKATMLDCLNRVVTVLGDGVFDELAADTLLSDVRALVERFK